MNFDHFQDVLNHFQSNFSLFSALFGLIVFFQYLPLKNGFLFAEKFSLVRTRGDIPPPTVAPSWAFRKPDQNLNIKVFQAILRQMFYAYNNHFDNDVFTTRRMQPITMYNHVDSLRWVYGKQQQFYYQNPDLELQACFLLAILFQIMSMYVLGAPCGLFHVFPLEKPQKK